MKIAFHYTYLIVAISFIITGYFTNFIVFTSIIIIHELGHYIVAKLNKLNPQKITLYPFGGITKMNMLVNTKIEKELAVAISGIIFQTIYYLIVFILYKNNLVREYVFNIYKQYHYNILIFNLLPIYPLDGMNILNLMLSKFLPFKKTLWLNIIISIITVIIILKINYYCFNYTTIIIISIIIDNLIKFYRNIDYLFNKFLLERYLYNMHFKRVKEIPKISDMYKDKYHVFKENKTYLTEKQILLRRFKGNFKKYLT